MKVTLVSRDEHCCRLTGEGNLAELPLGSQVTLLEDVLGPDCYRNRVLLDLSHCDYMDSSGISWLLIAHKYFIEKGGRLVLHSLHPRVQSLFNLLRLSSVLRVAADEAAGQKLLQAAG